MRMHAVLRWALPAAGSAALVLAGGSSASAAVSAITYDGPSSPTTADTLTWTISADAGDTLACSVTIDAGTPSTADDCSSGSYAFPATSAGSYVLTVTDVTDSTSLPATPVDVTLPPPPAPTPAAPAPGHGIDRSPTWDLGLPSGFTSATCSIAQGATTIVAPTACTGPTWTHSLGAAPSDGVYELTVTVDGDGATSTGTASATADYTLDRTITLTGPSTGSDRRPAFAASGVDAALTGGVTCAVTGPRAVVTTCSDTSAALRLRGPDGDYTLTLTETDGAGNTSSASLTYTLANAVPPQPVITRAKSTDHIATPTFTVTEPDASAVVTCSVSSGATVTSCTATAVTISITGGDGTYTVTVTATEGAADAVNTFDYTYDATLTTPTVSRAKAVGRTTTPSFTVSGVDPDVVSVACGVTSGASVTSCTATGADISITGGDGTYTVSVTVTDAAGNTRTGTFDYTLDTTVTTPTVSRAKALDHRSNPSFGVTGVDPDVVSVSCTVTAGASVTACTSSGVSVSISGGDGTYTVSVTVTDAAGNTATGTFDYTLDTALATPTVSRAKALDHLSAPSFSISGVDPDVVSVSCTVTAGATVTGCTSSGMAISITGGDGTYTVSVTVTDAAGNTRSDTFDYTYDGTLTTPTVSRARAVDVSSAPSFAVTGVDPDVVSVSCAVSAGATVTSCTSSGVGISVTGGDGTYTVSVTVTDAAGNTRTGTFDYTLDTTLTKPTVSRAKALDHLTSPSFTVAGVDPDVVSVSCTVSAGATVTSCTATGVTIAITGSDGTYTVSVTVTDGAGNTKTGTFDYTLDTALTKPAVSRAKALDKDSTPSFTVSGVDPDVVSVTCTVSAGATVTACSSSGVSISVTGGDGTYTVSVTVTDAAGNTKTGTFAYTLDTTLTKPTVSRPKALDRVSSPSFAVTGVDPDVVSVSCTVSAGATVTSCTSSGVSISVTGGDGTYTVSVTVTDAAGNTKTGTFAYTLDTALTSPTLSRAKALDKDPTPSFTVSGVDPDVVSVTCAVSAGATVTSCTSSGVNLSVTGGDGTYTVSVTVTDAAGNTRTGTFDYTLDTTLTKPTVSRAKATDNNASPSFTVSGVDPDVVSVTCAVSAGATVTSCTSSAVSLSVTGGDGTYTVSVTVTDAAGNTKTGTFDYTLDTTLATPTVSRLKALDNNTAPTFAVGGVDPDVVSVSCTVTAGATVTACSATSTRISITGGDGTYTVTVTVTDAAGNTRSGTFDYTLDTALTKPTLSRAKSLDNDPAPSFTVGGVDPDVVSVSCAVSAGATVTSCTSSGVNVSITGGDGTYTVTVTVTDAAGNTKSGTFDYTLDRTLSQPTVARPKALDHNTTPSFGVSGIDPDVVSITCSVSAGATVTACTATKVTISITGSDGPYVVSVVVTDAAGNTKTGTFTYTLDTTLTTPTVGGAALGNSRAPAFSVSGVDGDVVSVTCTVSGLGNTVSACTASGVTINLSLAADGTYTVTVTVRDAAGNVRTGSFDYTLDTTLTTPVVTRAKAVDNTANPAFTVGGVDPDVVTVSCSVTGGATVTACTSTGVTLDITGGDGSYTVTVTVTDAAGNTRSGNFTYTYDTTLTTPTVSRAKALDHNTTPSFVVSGVDPDVTSVTCTVSAGATVTSCSAASARISITGGDGTYTISVTVTDAAGNTRTGTFAYTLDTTLATPVLSRPKSLDKATAPSFTISGVDPDVVSVSCAVTGAGATVSSCTAVGVTIDLSGAADGVHTVSVTVTDAAGNTRTATFAYTLDTTLTTPTVSRAKSIDNNTGPSFAVSGVDSDVVSVSCAVTGTGAQVTACSASGVTLDLTAAGDGTYTVSVTVTDAAGNVRTGTFDYTLDTGLSTPTVTRGRALDNATAPSFTVSGVDPDVVSVTCAVTGVGTRVTSCTSTGVTLDLSAAADGTYTVTVTVRDVAGNVRSASFDYTLDTTLTRPTISRAKAIDNDSAPAFTVSGVDPDVVTVACSVSAGATVSSCTASGVALSITGGDGSYTVTVNVTDAAGNVRTASFAYTLDTTLSTPAVTRPRALDNATSPTFTVSGVDPDVVTVTCAVTGTGSRVSSCTATGVTLDLTSAADGVYTVTVTVTDRAGNVRSASFDYTLDTTLTTPTISRAKTTDNTTTPIFVVSGVDADVVSVTCTASAGAAVTSCTATGVALSISGSDGSYTVTVTVRDRAGNIRTTSLSYTLDTTLTTPTVTRARALDNTTTPTFAVGSVDPDVASVSCTVTGVATVTSCTATGVTLSITGPDDVYVVTVTVTDNAGNVRSASFNYTLDTTLTTPTISRGKALDKNPTPTFGVAGVDADVTSLTCAATGGARVVSCSATGASLDLTGLADGTYALSVTVRDAAGNVRTATFNYTLDTVGPAAPGVGTPPTPGNDRTPTLTFSTEPGATLTCTIERYFQPVSSGPCPADGTLDLSGLADGEFEITVVATDAAGNVGQSTTVVYVLDTVAPDAAVITAPASPSPIETPTWIWTAEPGATAVCTVTNAAGAVVIGPVACTSPFVANLRALPDGNYTLTVVVTDAAGNNSAPARSDFDLDRTAPVPPTVVPPRSPDNSPTPRWIITGPRGALLTCTLLRGRKVIWGPAACPANGVFSLAGLPDGTYTLRVTATDRAGNVSAESVSTYVFDTTSPATPRLDYHSPTPSTNTSPFWGFTLPNGTMGRCQLWHDGTVIATKSCKGAVTFDLSGRPHGTYTVRIVAIDAAGNLSSPLVVTYQLGTKPSNGGGGPPPPPPSGPTTPGTGGHHGGGHHPRQPSSPGVVQQTINRINQLGRIARSGVKHAVQSVIPEAAGLLPAIHDRFTENVTSAVQGVVNAVSHAGGGTGFPLLLLFVVLLFLIMQNRIDRRDPKLALASVAADDTVEFLPPPSRGADR